MSFLSMFILFLFHKKLNHVMNISIPIKSVGQIAILLKNIYTYINIQVHTNVRITNLTHVKKKINLNCKM